jgi:non-ribosomal peptide synthetase component F
VVAEHPLLPAEDTAAPSGGGGSGAAAVHWAEGQPFAVVSCVLDPSATGVATSVADATAASTTASTATATSATTGAGTGTCSSGNHKSELAYVMFTSGSTGQPKAVLGSHRAMLHRFEWMAATFPIAADDVCCQTKSIAFVDFLWDTFGQVDRHLG